MNFRVRLRKLISYRSTLWNMSIRQLKTKYSGSMLGIWWAIIIPLILAISINFIFISIAKVGIENFWLFVLSGILPWLFFSSSLFEASYSFIVSSSILRQTTLPRELIPISSIVANFLNFIIGFLFLLPLFIISNVKVIKFLPFLLMVLLFHFFFLVGLGIFFSSMNVFFRDLLHLLPIGLMLWFWITPIFYSLDMLSFPYRWICLINPLTYYVISYQNILFEGTSPSLLTMFISFLISIFFFITGYIFFLKKEPMLLKRI